MFLDLKGRKQRTMTYIPLTLPQKHKTHQVKTANTSLPIPRALRTA
jgi:hypothetical protein